MNVDAKSRAYQFHAQNMKKQSKVDDRYSYEQTDEEKVQGKYNLIIPKVPHSKRQSVDASLVSSALDLTQNRLGHSATQSVDNSNNIEYFQDEAIKVNARDSILVKHKPADENVGRSIINIKADNARLSNRTSITVQTPFDNSMSIRDPESAVRLRAKFFGQGQGNSTKPTKKKSKGKPAKAMMPKNYAVQTHSRDVMPVIPISHDGHNSGGSQTKVSYLIKQPSYTQVR